MYFVWYVHNLNISVQASKFNNGHYMFRKLVFIQLRVGNIYLWYINQTGNHKMEQTIRIQDISCKGNS